MPVSELTARRLLATLATEQTQGRIPSVAAAVIRDGSLAWAGARGTATGRPGVRPADLQYRIGSITKTMTAVLVLQLRDEGRLSLTDPLRAHVPEAPYGDRSLRALLSHGSGLPAEPAGEWWERSRGRTRAELLDAQRDQPAVFEPGRTHHYSNLGYALLGEVVARAAGTPWEELLQDRLLDPLGMARTSYHPADPHAQGYSVAPWAPVLTMEPATDTGAMAPAGQLWSTVEDLAAYAGLLAGGRPDLLSPDTLEEMCTPQSGTAADGPGSGYGLGLRLLTGGSGSLVGHTGSMPGFQASLFVDRERGTGAVVLANSTTGLRTDRVGPELLDVLESSEPALPGPWVPVEEVPEAVGELLGLWHWGNTPLLLVWDGTRLSATDPATGTQEDTWRLDAGRLVGASGYHHGEPLDVVRRADGTVSHLVASTFVLTRTPYDPDAPIPGGAPLV